MNFKTSVIYSRILGICALLMLQALLTGCGTDRALTLEDLSRQENAGETAEEALNGERSDETVLEDISADAGSGSTELPADTVAESGELMVYVCGAVEHSGVYRLPEGARICDALEAAGGMRPDAAEGYLNLAAPVTDGQELYFPTVAEVSGQMFPGGPESGSGSLVNINTADAAALQALPGVGATKAAAILNYREKNGSFRTTEDLMKVSGIGESTYENLKDFVTVGP